jgi:hypothetical protein
MAIHVARRAGAADADRVNEPELLESGPERSRPTRLRAVGLLGAVAVAAAGIVMVRGQDSPARIPAPSPSPSPAPIAAPTGALVVRYGTEIDRIPLAGGPWRQVSVPAAVGDAFLTPDGTTLVQSDGRRLLLVPVRPLRPAIVAAPAVAVLPGIGLPPYVWLLTDQGRLERYDPLRRRRTGDWLPVPAGWRVRSVLGDGVEVVTRPAGNGVERIGSFGAGPATRAGGRPATVTDIVVGHYLGAGRSGIVWLDPACPRLALSGPPCRLHVDGAALDAPPGVTFVAGSATISAAGDLLVPARTLDGVVGTSLLIRIFGQNTSGNGFGSPLMVPGSAGVHLASGIVFVNDGPVFLRASLDGRSYSFLATPGGNPPLGWPSGRTIPGAPQLLGLDQSGGG